MKLFKNAILTLSLVVGIALTSCSNDDDNQGLILTDSETYDLYDVNNSEVMGTITLFNNDSTAVVITIQLAEATGQTHPATLYFETANENGAVAVALNDVNGNGFSATNFSELDNGTNITYNSMLDFDGSIKIETSSTDNSLVAIGDIGQNAFTGNSTTRPLNEVNNSGVSGLVIFAERNSGEALVAVQLDGTVDGVMHPAEIMNGDVSTPGSSAATLNPVDGTYGESRTSLNGINNTNVVFYSELLTFNGHVNVRYSATDNTIVAQGNFGANN